MGSSRLDVSVFAIVVWYTFRHTNMFKFSALLRTMLAQATVYIIAIIIMQIYIQVSLSCADQSSLVQSLFFFCGVVVN